MTHGTFNFNWIIIAPVTYPKNVPNGIIFDVSRVVLEYDEV